MIIQLQKVILGSFLVLISADVKNCDKAFSSLKDFDIVILNGRVIDPESNLDAIRNIGIKEGTVRLITGKEIKGVISINAQDLVVAPGFIDIHQHGQDQENYAYKIMDGVTTALELELGTSDVDRWYMEREGKTIINHGVSIGHIPLRMSVLHDSGDFVPVGDAAYKAATSYSPHYKFGISSYPVFAADDCRSTFLWSEYYC